MGNFYTRESGTVRNVATECQVCLEQYNVVDRRPKFLPCGHSFCLPCLQQLPVKVCPLDRKEFLTAPEELVDNFSLLDTPSRPPRFWCITCKKEASTACVEEHAVRSLRKERAEEAEQHLQSLQRGEAGVLKLQAALVSAHRDVDLEDCQDRLQRELASLHAARARVQGALEADSAGWERAQEAAVLGGLASDAALLAAHLSDPAVECSVTVRCGNGEAWKGVVQPAGEAAARLLLCRMVCSGLLQQTAQQNHHHNTALHWEEISNTANLSGADMRALMEKGCRVARVWRRGQCRYEAYKDYEGMPPGSGTVTCLSDNGAHVKWHRTGLIGSYWMMPGSYDLRLLPPPLQADVGAAPWVLSVDFISACADMKPKWKLLADTYSFDKVRTLTGLHCAPAAQWSQTVLEQVAPHLEGLQLVNPDQQHIDLVVTMPRLQRLAITDVTGNTLQKVVQMASLRSLELHCRLELPLPALDLTSIAAGLQWLRCGVHPLAAALALARQHAGSLEELQLVAASTQPYGCTDLAQRLQRCGFSKLRRVVLLRHDAYDNFCRHDEKSCKKQVLHITFFLSESDLSVDVLCTTCNPECLTTK